MLVDENGIVALLRAMNQRVIQSVIRNYSHSIDNVDNEVRRRSKKKKKVPSLVMYV